MRCRRYPIALGAACLAIAACSGSSASPPAGGGSGTMGGGTGSNSVTGTVQGVHPMVADVIAAKGVDDPAFPNRVSIIFSSRAALCPLLQQVLSGPPAGVASATMFILVLTPTSTSGALTPGTYSAAGGNLLGTYETFDATCMSINPHEDVTSGTATVSAVGTSVIGTFDLMLGTDHVTGSFDAPFCTVPPRSDAGTSGDGGLLCLH